jgi:hypothetical protein
MLTAPDVHRFTLRTHAETFFQLCPLLYISSSDRHSDEMIDFTVLVFSFLDGLYEHLTEHFV